MMSQRSKKTLVKKTSKNVNRRSQPFAAVSLARQVTDRSLPKALAQYRRVLQDPFNFHAPSLGAAGVPTAIVTLYRKTIYSQLPQTAWFFTCGPYATGGTRECAVSSSATAWGNGTPLDYTNSPAILTVAPLSRPVAGGIRMTVRYPATVAPPIVSGGLTPFVQHLTLDTPWQSTLTPLDVFATPFTVTAQGASSSIMTTWRPNDVVDLEEFRTTDSALPTNTGSSANGHQYPLPFLQIIGAGSNVVIEVEAIFHMETTGGSRNASYYTIANDQAAYLPVDLWRGLVKNPLPSPVCVDPPNPRGNIHNSPGCMSGMLKGGSFWGSESKAEVKRPSAPGPIERLSNGVIDLERKGVSELAKLADSLISSAGSSAETSGHVLQPRILHSSTTSPPPISVLSQFLKDNQVAVHEELRELYKILLCAANSFKPKPWQRVELDYPECIRGPLATFDGWVFDPNASEDVEAQMPTRASEKGAMDPVDLSDPREYLATVYCYEHSGLIPVSSH